MTACTHAELIREEGPIHANDNPPIYRCQLCNEFVRVLLAPDSVGVSYGAPPAAPDVTVAGQTDLHGVHWKDSIKANGIADEICIHFAKECSHLIAIRGDVIHLNGSGLYEEQVGEIATDLIGTLTGTKTDLDPEDLDEDTCSLLWVEQRLYNLLKAAALPTRSEAQQWISVKYKKPEMDKRPVMVFRTGFGIDIIGCCGQSVWAGETRWPITHWRELPPEPSSQVTNEK